MEFLEDYSNRDFINEIFRDKNLTEKSIVTYPIPGLKPRERVVGPDFGKSNLTNAVIYNCDVEAWRMTEANLTGLRSALNKGRPRLPKDWFLIDGYFIGPGANLSPLSMDNRWLKTRLSVASLKMLTLDAINLSESELSHVSFTNSSLRHVNFTSSIIQNVDFSGADLTGADFTNCEINNCNFDNSNLTNAKFSESTLRSINGRNIYGSPLGFPSNYLIHNKLIIGPNTNLSNINIGLVNLEKLDLSGVQSGGLNCAGELPEGWTFAGGYLFGPRANLRGHTFRNIELDGVNLEGADFEGSEFENCVIKNISGQPKGLASKYIIARQTLIGPNMSLKGFDLTDYDLRDATLTGIHTGGISGTPMLSKDWKLINGYLVGPGANLKGANFSNQTFENVNIQGANLLDANLQGVRSRMVYGQPVNLPSGWKLTGHVLLGPGACIEDVDLSRSNLNGVSVKDLNGKPSALPPEWGFFSRYIIGPGADLSGLNLDGVDLTNANLQRISSNDVTGNPFLPNEWTIQGGILFGPGATLNGFDLKGFRLQGLNLSSAKITNCDLSNVNLTSIKLTNAEIYSTKFSGAKLINADLQHAEISHCELDKVDLSSANLRNGKIFSSNLGDVLLHGSDLESVEMTEVNLTGARTSGIKGTPSNLPRGYILLNNAIVGPATIIDNQDFSDTVTTNIILQDTSLSSINFDGAQWTGIQGQPLELPPDYFIFESTLFGPKVTVTSTKFEGHNINEWHVNGAIFKSVSFHSDNFEKSDMHGTSFENAFFFKCNFQDIDFTNSFFKDCDFEKCTFSDTDFSNAKFSHVSFLECGVYVTNFNKASLDDVDIRESDIGQIDFSSCSFENVQAQNVKTSLITAFPLNWPLPGNLELGEDQRTFEIQLWQNRDLTGLDLKRAKGIYGYNGLPVIGRPKSVPEDVLIDDNRLFSNFTLSEEDISGAQLEGKNLRAWKLYRVKSGRVTGDVSLPSGWRLVNGYLVGPTANLNFAKLAGADLSGLDLRDVTFRSADLSGANFMYCSLDRVDFSNAILNNAIFPTGFVPNTGF